jgi:membrane-associated phospholipid phosphatase
MRQYAFVDYVTQGYCALVALLILCFHNGTVRGWPWLLASNVLILVLVHALILWHARRPRSKPLDFLRCFYPVLLYTWFFCETGLINRMFVPDYLDPMVIHWDQKLFGAQLSVRLMQKFPYPLLSEILYAAYFSYYLMVAGVGLALLLRNRDQFFHYVSVVSFVFYVCYVIYIFLPVIGPMVFFHEVEGYALPAHIQQLAPTDVYPEAIKAGVMYRLMAWIYRVFEAPGAALPSSHVAIAICTLYFSFRYLRNIRYLHLAAAILLCVATIYGHYHYVSDVLTGLLTAAVLLPLANWLYFRQLRSAGEPRRADARQPENDQSRRLANT